MSPQFRRVHLRLERWFGGERIFVLVLAAFVGLLAGLGAVGFRELILLVQWVAWQGPADFHVLARAPVLLLILAPALGGLAVGLITRFGAREARGHGVPEVMNAVANRGGVLQGRLVLLKSLTAALTIGSGGSAGREGPIVQIGGALGSKIGQLVGVSGERLTVLLGCGAAAGMGATFDAPITGVLLVAELIIGSASVGVLAPLVVASVIGTLTARLFFGGETLFVEAPAYRIASFGELPLYVLLGLLAGLTAVLFTQALGLVERNARRLPVPVWTLPAIGGLLVGAIGIGFPEALGGGYDAIDAVLQGQGTLVLLATLVLVKILTTALTLGSGGSGGVFAPSLVIGACLGGAFGMILERLWPGFGGGPGAYALVGMGAVMAGATHAPLTAILMLYELTGNAAILPPVMLACVVAVVLASRLLPTSIFTTGLKEQGVRLRSSVGAELLHQTPVSALSRREVERVGLDTALDVLLDRLQHAIPPQLHVLDGAGGLRGVVSLGRVRAALDVPDLDRRLVVAADLMRSPAPRCREDTSLDQVLGLFNREDVEVLAVVDADEQLVGAVTQHDIMVFIERELLREEATAIRFGRAGGGDAAGFVEIPAGHVVDTVAVTAALAGRSLRDLDLRAKAGLNVIGVRRVGPDGVERLPPEPERALKRGEVLVVVGEEKAVRVFRKSIG